MAWDPPVDLRMRLGSREYTLRHTQIEAFPGRVQTADAFRIAVPADGNAGPLRDTLLVDREQTVQIGFVAEKRGNWLLHCHTLERSTAGMRTRFRVG